jgi:dynein light intermediate chain 1
LSSPTFTGPSQAVRKFSLTYGASLFYTSVKEDKNTDLLYKYLVHTSYGFPLTTPALVVERDALFVPAGWDSAAKVTGYYLLFLMHLLIFLLFRLLFLLLLLHLLFLLTFPLCIQLYQVSILHENLFKFRPEQTFSDVIKSPFLGGKGSKPLQARTQEQAVVAESEQDFLARLAPFLLQEGGLPSAGLSSHLHHSTESVLKTPERRLAGSPGVHSALKRSEFGPGKTPNDGAISNFFHALLQKKTGSTTHLPVVDPADILAGQVMSPPNVVCCTLYA